MPTLNLGQVRPVYRGAWNSIDTYVAYDFVIYNGSAYLALKDVPANYEPPSQTDYWVLFGAKGEQGEPGEDGVDGAPGERGPSPAYRWDGTFLSIQNPDGTWPDQGIDLQGPAVPLSNSVTSTSETDAASSKAVKIAYDKADEAYTVAEAALPKTGGDISGQLTINGDSVARAGSNTKFNRHGYNSSPPLVWGGTHDDLINYNLYFTEQLRVYGANRAGSLCHSGNLDNEKKTTFLWDTAIETSYIAAFNSDGSQLHPVLSDSLSVYTSASLQGCVARVNGQPIGLAGTWLVIFVGNDFNIKTAVIDGGAIPATENKNYVAIRIQ
ncbi:MAG: tail fiber protein [Bilophila wadsworthia]|uniref:tail fiber protein n=1 Tax=Bilophila wadsworthia TaxID=35833 RepID=UPI00242C4EFB|nr:tail fiber protein [Bilophila wadsworthia]MCI6539202.1 tail fiber protein [Bilophila wadsworthia]